MPCENMKVKFQYPHKAGLQPSRAASFCVATVCFHTVTAALCSGTSPHGPQSLIYRWPLNWEGPLLPRLFSVVGSTLSAVETADVEPWIGRADCKVTRGFSAAQRVGAAEPCVVQWSAVLTPWSFIESFPTPASDDQKSLCPPRVRRLTS